MIAAQTKAAIMALLSADEGITPDERQSIESAINGHAPAFVAPQPMPTVMSAQEVARVTGLSTRSLRSYARRGLLRRAYYGGSTRAWGYHADSVRNFIDSATK